MARVFSAGVTLKFTLKEKCDSISQLGNFFSVTNKRMGRMTLFCTDQRTIPKSGAREPAILVQSRSI